MIFTEIYIFYPFADGIVKSYFKLAVMWKKDNSRKFKKIYHTHNLYKTKVLKMFSYITISKIDGVI